MKTEIILSILVTTGNKSTFPLYAVSEGATPVCVSLPLDAAVNYIEQHLDERTPVQEAAEPAEATYPPMIVDGAPVSLPAAPALSVTDRAEWITTEAARKLDESQEPRDRCPRVYWYSMDGSPSRMIGMTDDEAGDACRANANFAAALNDDALTSEEFEALWNHCNEQGLFEMQPEEDDGDTAARLDSELRAAQPLIEFARAALRILEEQEEWSASTPDDIAAAAFRLGVADTNEHSEFRSLNR